jgi:hypothetical protein
MHIAIGLTRGMYLFALVMIVWNLAAFGPDFGPLFLAYPQHFRAAFPEKQLSPWRGAIPRKDRP